MAGYLHQQLIRSQATLICFACFHIQAESNLKDSDIADLFDLFDTSGDGLVSFEEFQHALKAEMELLEVQDHFEVVEGDDVEARKKEQAAIMGAMHRGVRINRSASVEGDVKMQGNAEMMSRAVGRHCHCHFCKQAL